MAKRWRGSSPTKCDMCNAPLKKTFVDGKTRSGPWGMLCPACHKAYGVGLGLGCGQRYELRPDGTWEKTGG